MPTKDTNVIPCQPEQCRRPRWRACRRRLGPETTPSLGSAQDSAPHRRVPTFPRPLRRLGYHHLCQRRAVRHHGDDRTGKPAGNFPCFAMSGRGIAGLSYPHLGKASRPYPRHEKRPRFQLLHRTDLAPMALGADDSRFGANRGVDRPSARWPRRLETSRRSVNGYCLRCQSGANARGRSPNV